MLLCVTMRCYALLCITMHCYALLCIARRCYAMIYVAMRCYTLLCDAMCCYTFLCIAMYIYGLIFVIKLNKHGWTSGKYSFARYHRIPQILGRGSHSNRPTRSYFGSVGSWVRLRDPSRRSFFQ